MINITLGRVRVLRRGVAIGALAGAFALAAPHVGALVAGPIDDGGTIQAAAYSYRWLAADGGGASVYAQTNGQAGLDSEVGTSSTYYVSVMGENGTFDSSAGDLPPTAWTVDTITKSWRLSFSTVLETSGAPCVVDVSVPMGDAPPGVEPTVEPPSSLGLGQTLANSGAASGMVCGVSVDQGHAGTSSWGGAGLNPPGLGMQTASASEPEPPPGGGGGLPSTGFDPDVAAAGLLLIGLGALLLEGSDRRTSATPVS